MMKYDCKKCLCKDVCSIKLPPSQILKFKCPHFKDHTKHINVGFNRAEIAYAECKALREIHGYHIASVLIKDSYISGVFIRIYEAVYINEEDKSQDFIIFTGDDIGRTVFHTREEAEQALKREGKR